MEVSQCIEMIRIFSKSKMLRKGKVTSNIQPHHFAHEDTMSLITRGFTKAPLPMSGTPATSNQPMLVVCFLPPYGNIKWLSTEVTISGM